MNRTVVHDSFVIERYYKHPTNKVFAAWADGSAKSQWFGADENIRVDAYTLDFRVGGREHLTAKAPDDALYTFDAVYQDIVEASRIVWSYEMTVDGRRMSVSVATVELHDEDGGTKLIMTEQGAFLDGLDTNDARAEGTREFLDTLGEFLG